MTKKLFTSVVVMKKLLATIAILIIINMPIAYAQFLNYYISGTDNINHIVQEEDSLTVDVQVSIEDDPEITPDQVWLGTSNQFDSCVPDIEGYSCSLTFPAEGTWEFDDRTPFTINLHTDDHNTPPDSFTIVDKISGDLVVDTFPPRVIAALDPPKANNELTVSYTAFDDSYQPNIYDVCAGVKSIEFFTEDLQIDVIFDFEQNTCEVEDSFEIDVSEVAEGSYELIIESIDHLDHLSTIVLPFEVDRTGGNFWNLSISKDGYEVYNIGSSEIDVTVSVDASPDSKIDSIRANLEALNPLQNYDDLEGTCQEFEDRIHCTWDVIMQEFGVLDLIFSAEDDIGNQNEQVLSRTVAQDIEGPRALTLSTDNVGFDGTTYLMILNNTIFVTFTETGAGLAPEDVYLDLSDLGDSSKLAASSCDQGWTCTWEDVNFDVTDGTYTIIVHEDTSDILGNVLKEDFDWEVVIDTLAPQIVNVEVNKIGGGLQNYEGIFIIGDTIQIIAQVHEPGTILEAYADFSAFIEDAFLVNADSCVDIGDDLWECIWIAGPIDKSGFINSDVVMTFIDFLENAADFKTTITVYDLETSFEDHFSSSIDCSPTILDRQVAALVDFRIYCHIDLTGNAQILSMDLLDCTGDGAKYIRTQELFNDETNDPYIKLTLNTANIPEDNLEFICPLVLVSKTETSVSSIPEVENLEINLPVEESPLGELGDNLEEKIDDAIEDATGGLWEVITALNKILFYAERLCSLITTINNVASFFSSVGMLNREAGELLQTNAVTAAEGLAQEKLGQDQQSITSNLNQQMRESWLIKTEDGIGGGINKFCKFISCRLYYDDVKWTGDIGKSIGSWQRQVMEYANLAATGFGYGEFLGIGGQGVNAYTYQSGATEERGGISAQRVLQGGKLNPKDSIVISFLSLCLPGIIYNLDKLRQIECLYADCLQTSVETGVPIYACEDAKDYETCKYWTGELFQIAPFTGLADYFIGLVKGVLYNPLGIVDLAFGYMCTAPISTKGAAEVAKICLFNEMAGMIADVWSDIANIKDDWKIKNDYCANIEDDEDDDKDEGSGLGGLFS